MDKLSQSDCGSKSVRVRNGLGQSCYKSGWVDLYFHRNLIIFLYIKKTCKLLYVKCIVLNSPLISRMSLVKQINNCSIILKLYKYQHY